MDGRSLLCVTTVSASPSRHVGVRTTLVHSGKQGIPPDANLYRSRLVVLELELIFSGSLSVVKTLESDSLVSLSVTGSATYLEFTQSMYVVRYFAGLFCFSAQK